MLHLKRVTGFAMQATFGYQDGSGEFYVTFDTDKCNGCGACVTACPANILELAANEFDPLAVRQIAIVKHANRKTLQYDCGPCKPPRGPAGTPCGHARALPCVRACQPGAIVHSW